MTSLSATTTVDRGVAMYAQLRRDADALVGTGQADGRTRDQVMADLVYERVTGRDSATGPAVEVELLISTDTLLGVDTWTDDQSDGWADEVDGPPSAGESGDTPLSVDLTLCHDASMTTTADADAADATDADEDVTRAGNRPPRTVPDPGRTAHSPAGRSAADESALLTADGVVPVPIPAPIARELVADASQLWLRRLFTHPDTGDLIAMESRSRLFSDALKDFIRFRDQYCSTPYCGAPIRHADHAIPAERGGPTSERNGNGKCAACNLAKQAPGWRQIPAGHGRGALVTPTGHTYDLAPPRLPGARPRTDDVIVDVLWRALNCAARRAAA